MFVSDLCVVARFQAGEWALTQPLVWQQRGLRIEVPTGFITDLASIPGIFRGVLSIVGGSRRPAVLHDFLYSIQVLPREDADDLLRVALMAEGMSAGESATYRAGVRIGGRRPWNARARRGGGLQPDDFIDPALFEAAMGSAHIIPTPDLSRPLNSR